MPDGLHANYARPTPSWFCSGEGGTQCSSRLNRRGQPGLAVTPRPPRPGPSGAEEIVYADKFPELAGNPDYVLHGFTVQT